MSDTNARGPNQSSQQNVVRLDMSGGAAFAQASVDKSGELGFPSLHGMVSISYDVRDREP